MLIYPMDIPKLHICGKNKQIQQTKIQQDFNQVLRG